MATTGEFEPQVGEIRAIRTFRVGPGGFLFPLFSKQHWADGDNEAACNVVSGHESQSLHSPPDPDCTCGFYGYANLAGAGEYPNTRHVLAVVTYWGRVIVATKGIRAQYGRIEAIWMSTAVPADLAHSVAVQYPNTRVYSDRAAMLCAHAPTVLADYDTNRFPSANWQRVGARLLAAAAIGAGLLAPQSIGQLPFGRAVWIGLLSGLLLVALVPRRLRQDAVMQRRRLTCMALALWMIAPLAGPAGFVFLRMPLFQIALLIWVQRSALRKMARTFPAKIV